MGMGPPLVAALLVIGVPLTAAALVLDQALIGLALGHLQLWRNTYFAGLKLLLLGGLAVLPLTVTSGQILATWVLGSLLSLVLLAVHLRRHGVRLSHRPRRSAISGLGRVTLDHNLLNLALAIPRMAVPLVIASGLSAAGNAQFFTAWMVAGFLYIMPSHTSTALFAVANGDAAELRAKLRFTALISYGLGAPASVLLALLAGPVMSVFGHEYTSNASGCLAVLALTYLPVAVKYQYVAVSRVNGLIRDAAVTAVLAAVAELAAAWYGARHGNITTIAECIALVTFVEAAVMAPRVIAAARARPTDGRPDAPDALHTSAAPDALHAPDAPGLSI
jgi:O-antigen/teichoic acid export membrane protein